MSKCKFWSIFWALSYAFRIWLILLFESFISDEISLVLFLKLDTSSQNFTTNSEGLPSNEPFLKLLTLKLIFSDISVNWPSICLYNWAKYIPGLIICPDSFLSRFLSLISI